MPKNSPPDVMVAPTDHADGSLERSPPKWMPVRRKRARQNMGLEPCPIARRSGTALAAALPPALRSGEVSVILTPRLLSKAQAAAYCSVSQGRFDRWRRDGKMPDPLQGTARWDRIDIDAAIDDLKKLGKLTSPAKPALPPIEEDPLAAWLATKGPKPWKV